MLTPIEAHPPLEVVDAQALIDDALGLVAPVLRLHSVNVQSTVEPRLAVSVHRRTAILCLLARLMDQAIAILALRDTGRELVVTAKLTEFNRVCVDIEDNGPAWQYSRWLEVLRITPCRELEQDPNGFITYDRTARGWTAARVYLKSATTADIEARASVRDTTVSARILVVEDDQEVADHLGFVLRDLGYQVEHVRNGYEGLVRLRASDYAVILLDLRMPVVDGGLFLRALSQEHGDLMCRVIVISGHLEEYASYLEEYAVPCLAKPFARQALLDAIHAKIG
jgi:CheY-like chemotaxis protein